MAGVDRDAPRTRQVGGDRLAKLGQPGRGAVARVAVAQRLRGGVHDVRRGVDARLADLEVQHLAALGLERLGAGQHLEGGLGAEAGECVCKRRGQGAKVIGGLGRQYQRMRGIVSSARSRGVLEN